MSHDIKILDAEKPIRMGVIGLGGASQLIHLPMLSQMDSIEIVGLVDEEPYKLSKMSEKYNIPGWVDGENFLRRTKPDLVFIATPTISHLPLALKSLQAGAHVIVEKPAARNLDEAKRLLEASEEFGRQVFVAMNQRFRQDVMVLRNFLSAGELGDIWRVRTGWLKRIGAWNRSPWLDQKVISGGGVLMDLGIQLLDGILWLLDYPEPARVLAFKHNHTLEREVEDTLSASIVLKNGTLINMDCSWGLLSNDEVAYTHFEGKKATASLNPLMLHKTLQDELVTVTPVKTGDPRQLYHASFEAQMHHFISSLRGEVTPISTVAESVKVMELVDMIYASAREGREIVAD